MALSAVAAASRRTVACVALAWLALAAGVASAAETLAASLREEVICIDKPGRAGIGDGELKNEFPGDPACSKKS